MISPRIQSVYIDQDRCKLKFIQAYIQNVFDHYNVTLKSIKYEKNH